MPDLYCNKQGIEHQKHRVMKTNGIQDRVVVALMVLASFSSPQGQSAQEPEHGSCQYAA